MEKLVLGLSTFGLGFGTVFVGLICLILIIKLMSLVFSGLNAKKAAAQEAPAPSAPAPAAEIPDRGQFIAAVSTAIAASIGGDVSGLRILSVKKVNND